MCSACFHSIEHVAVVGGVSPFSLGMTSNSHVMIHQMIKDIEHKDGAAIVSLYELIKCEGIKLGLLEHRKLPIDRVGVHRHNRDGVIVSGREAMLLLAEVARIGVSLDLLKDATAFEEPPTRVNEKALIAKTDNDKLLARYKDGQVTASSVACSHFNQALAAVQQGLQYEHPMLSSADGRLSKEKLCMEHPLLAPIFEHGLKWWVWKAEAEVLFPKLASIAQTALNAKYSVQQGMDSFQLYIRAVRCLNNPSIAAHDRVNFAVRDIVKSNPKNADTVPFIVETARKFGGGDEQFVLHLIDYCGGYKQAGREVAHATWKALAGLKFTSANMCPNFIVSVLMCIAGQRLPSSVQAGDVKSFQSKIADIMKVEAIINQAQQLCTAMQVKHEHAIEHMGSLRATLVLKIVDRSKELKDASIESIASRFYMELKAVARIDQPSPWEEHAAIGSNDPTGADTVQTKPIAQAAAVIQYDERGQATNSRITIMQHKGFTIGSNIKNKVSGDCRA
jgi:hypothetical protein